ncbi:hypothetical protein ASC90_07570 [Rhizobium sp. Root1220]|nr:hypothetical protein ASC90_07570 [Rhizobium sp. Root1220]
MGSILDGFEADGALRLPEIDLQPLAANEAAKGIARLALSSPRDSIVEFAGPQSISLNDIASEYLTATSDSRSVRSDPSAMYFGVGLPPDGLLPGRSAMLSELSFHDWIRREVLAIA